MIRTSAFVLTVLCLACGSSALAQSGEPEPTSADAPLRVGPVRLLPTLSIYDVGVDSNIYSGSVLGPREDFTYTVAPSVKAVLPIRDTRLTGNGGLGFVYFRELKDQQSLNGSLSGQFDVNSGRIRPFGTAALTRSRARTGFDVDTRAQSTAIRTRGGATVGVSPLTSVTAWLMREATTFARDEAFRGVSLSEQLDRVTTGGAAGLRFEVTPLTSVVTVLEVEKARFKEASIRDSDSLRFAPIVQFSEGAIIAGQASAGVRDFKPLDPRLARYRGFVASASLGFTILNVTRVDAQADRDVSYSYDDVQPIYLGAGGRITVTQRIAGPVEGIVIGGRQRLRYQSLDGLSFNGRRESVRTIGAGLGIRIDQHMRFAMTVEHEERLSNGALWRQYDRRRVFGSLTYAP